MPLGEHPSTYMIEEGSYFGKGGALVTKLGTLNTGTIMTSGEQVVGAAKWVEKNRIVYLIYSDLGDHAIAYYDIAQNIHVKMCTIVDANFDPNYPVRHCEVIDNVLWWTDGKDEGYYDDNGVRLFNPPFRLNLQRVEDGEYSSYNLQTIDVIKYPSPFSPTYEYATTTSYASNFLKNKLFQFRVLYVYEDGEESAWSPISRLNILQDAGFINGSYLPTPQDNVIRLNFNTGDETVKKIKLAVSVNKGQFGVFKTLDKDIEGIPSDDDYSLSYSGNTSFDPIPLDAKNYDNVPQTAVCFNKLVSEICYTNITRGYDRLEPNIVVDYPITEIPYYRIGAHSINIDRVTNLLMRLSWEDANGSDLLNISVGDYYTFQIRISDTINANINMAYTITQNDYAFAYSLPTPQEGRDYLMDVIGNAFLSQINTSVPGAATGLMAGSDFEVTFVLAHNILGDLPQDGLRPLRRQNTAKTLKKGVIYKWYIQYYDRANRDGTALTTTAMQVRVPYVTDQDLSSLSYDGAPYKVNARISINHFPPIWATHYQILVAKDNGISSFMQTTIIAAAILEDGSFRFSLQDAYSIINKGATINHQIQKGDIVRFLQNGVGDSESPAPLNYIRNYFECEVLNFEISGGEGGTMAIYVQRFDLSLIGWNSERGIHVEIYTPTRDSDVEQIFEVGEEYEIRAFNTSACRHKGNVQDQTDTLPAIIDVDYGDVYIRQRMLGTGYAFPQNVAYWYCEDPHYSDYYISNFNNRGRIGIEDVNAKNDRYNLSVHGGKAIRETNINNLSSFELGDNTQEYDTQYGYVTICLVDGKTLKVLQPLKETSVYLNASYVVNADGESASPAFSNKVFGGYRPYEGTFGCSNAGLAVLIPKKGIFYYDSINLEFIYSINNGQERVSLNGYLKGTLDFSEIEQGDNSASYSFVESEYGKVGMNVRSDNGGKTITFNYEKMRFMCEHESKSVWGYQNLGDVLVAFNQDLNTYLYNQVGSFDFHDTLVSSHVWVVSNVSPEQMKRFKSISVQGLNAWQVETFSDENATYINSQTRMLFSAFKLLEGAWYSQYRKVLNTYPSKSEEYNLINGRDLRAYAIANRLSCVPAIEGENDVSLVVVESIPSELITQ
jgi:hypothetical protein